MRQMFCLKSPKEYCLPLLEGLYRQTKEIDIIGYS